MGSHRLVIVALVLVSGWSLAVIAGIWYFDWLNVEVPGDPDTQLAFQIAVASAVGLWLLGIAAIATVLIYNRKRLQ
jgi:hypothetical protein